MHKCPESAELRTCSWLRRCRSICKRERGCASSKLFVDPAFGRECVRSCVKTLTGIPEFSSYQRGKQANSETPPFALSGKSEKLYPLAARLLTRGPRNARNGFIGIAAPDGKVHDSLLLAKDLFSHDSSLTFLRSSAKLVERDARATDCPYCLFPEISRDERDRWFNGRAPAEFGSSLYYLRSVRRERRAKCENGRKTRPYRSRAEVSKSGGASVKQRAENSCGRR